MQKCLGRGRPKRQLKAGKGWVGGQSQREQCEHNKEKHSKHVAVAHNNQMRGKQESDSTISAKGAEETGRGKT